MSERSAIKLFKLKFTIVSFTNAQFIGSRVSQGISVEKYDTYKSA